ncbi:MAG: hypothetical protein ACI9BV_003789, partial [Rhodothermales bacterium]
AIDNREGERVRNLTAAAFFEKGTQTVYWDLLDEGQLVNRRRNGAGFTVDRERKTVPPGEYQVTLLTHRGLRLSAPAAILGSEPGEDQLPSESWLSDHSGPSDVAFVTQGPCGPSMLVSARIAEAGESFAWLDSEGRRICGQRTGWEGAVALAQIEGSGDWFAATVHQGQLSVWRHREGSRRRLFSVPAPDDPLEWRRVGLTTTDGHLVVSVPWNDQIHLASLRNLSLARWSSVSVPNPSGLTFWRGRLLVVSAGRVHEIEIEGGRLSPLDWIPVDNATFLDSGPTELIVGEEAEAHFVHVFPGDGSPPLRLGADSGLQIGYYDQSIVHRPNGAAIDESGRVWVAESSEFVRRLSVWDSQGALVFARYSDTKYGGGGMVDPRDPSLIYYAAAEHKRRISGTLMLAPSAEPRVQGVLAQIPADGAASTWRLPAPEHLLHADGREYLTNTYNRTFAGMTGIVGIWMRRGDSRTFSLVAATGFLGHKVLDSWPGLESFLGEEVIITPNRSRSYVFTWSDSDLDGDFSAGEIKAELVEGAAGNVAISEDWAVASSRGEVFGFLGFDVNGIPKWGLPNETGPSAEDPDVDVLRTADGWTIYPGGAMRGFGPDRASWTYPIPWYRRGARSYPTDGGRLVEAGRIAGPEFSLGDRIDQQGFAVAGDRGSVYLFTTDGLFVQDLGGDYRTIPEVGVGARDGTRRSFGFEPFWTTVRESAGGVYLVGGRERSTRYKIDGLESLGITKWGVQVSEGPQASFLERSLPESTVIRMGRVFDLDQERGWQGILTLAQGTSGAQVCGVRSLFSGGAVTLDLLFHSGAKSAEASRLMVEISENGELDILQASAQFSDVAGHIAEDCVRLSFTNSSGKAPLVDLGLLLRREGQWSFAEYASGRESVGPARLELEGWRMATYWPALN